METKKICLSHLMLAESAVWHLQHQLPICRIVLGQQAAECLGCDLSELEAKLDAERASRDQASDFKCTVCAKPGFLISFPTFRTFCEKCYPDAPTSTVTLSGLTSEHQAEVLRLLATLHVEEYKAELPIGSSLSELQRAIRLAGRLPSNYSCYECKESLASGLKLVVRHRNGSFHYCAGCFGQRNTGTLFNGALMAEGMNAVLYMPLPPCEIFSRMMTTEFKAGTEAAQESCELQSSQEVRWDAFHLRTRGEINRLLINTWLVQFTAFRETPDLLCLILECEVPVPANTTVYVTVEATDSIVAAAPLSIGTDGTVWSQRGGIVASIDYYCVRSS